MDTTFAERVTLVVKESKLNQTDFAAKISISQQYLSQICNGKKTPSDRTISDICRIFDIQEDWLKHGQEPMRAAKSREEEISELVGAALNGSSDFKKAVIRMICSRTDKELEALEGALRNIYENIQQEKSQGG